MERVSSPDPIDADRREETEVAAPNGPGTLEWYLRGPDDEGGNAWRASLRPLPFRVGRVGGANLQLSSQRVSQQHAEFFLRETDLWIRDLGSTNGTFVNGESVTEQALSEGDLLHFGDQQFCLEAEPSKRRATRTPVPGTELSMAPRSVHDVKGLVELLRSEAVRVEYQPLVRLDDEVIVGYEALGRGAVPGLPSCPTELFTVAERLGLAVELSELFRRHQLTDGPRVLSRSEGVRQRLFINTHPFEVTESQGVLSSLRGFRAHQPDVPLVLEIHEGAVTDVATFRDLRHQLQTLDVGLAFDDFGTGQARLQELCDVSPDYVKFDLNFARDLHLASEKRREMVRTLVRMMVDMQITTVLEGVETAAEAEACRELGFDLAQGDHFAPPAPVETFLEQARAQESRKD